MRAELWALCFIGYGAIASATLLVLYTALRRRWARQRASAPEEPRDYDHWSVSDTRPDDIDVCSACKGSGEVVVSQDWGTGALNIEGCVRCGGRGVDPAQVPDWVAV